MIHSQQFEFITIKYIGDSPTGKTRIYDVISNEDGFVLGIIKWNPHWRKYWFLPSNDTGYEEKCMGDIANFLIMLKEDRMFELRG